jgi:hypothetical protein
MHSLFLLFDVHVTHHDDDGESSELFLSFFFVLVRVPRIVCLWMVAFGLGSRRTA